MVSYTTPPAVATHSCSPTCTTDELPRTASFRHTLAGRPKTTTDPNGLTVALGHDTARRPSMGDGLATRRARRRGACRACYSAGPIAPRRPPTVAGVTYWTREGARRVLSPSLLHRAAEWLDERFGVDALWVFGSEATGMATDTSDVDLAALFRRRPSALELLAARADLGQLLFRDVDLVDLDRASPIQVLQVLRYGKLVLDRDPARRNRLVAAAPGRYEDLRIVRREGERALLERVLDGRP